MVYVDTSVIVAMLSNEPKAPACIAWFAEQTQPPYSSDWLITEFYSAMALKQRTGQLQNKHIKTLLPLFHTLIESGLQLLPITRNNFLQAGQLCQQHPNTPAGDALHLSIALQSGMQQLVTLDQTQALTAQQLKLTVDLL